MSIILCKAVTAHKSLLLIILSNGRNVECQRHKLYPSVSFMLECLARVEPLSSWFLLLVHNTITPKLTNKG